MENDNQPADPEMESSSSSLSFILAEEIDSLNATTVNGRRSKDGTPDDVKDGVEVGVDSLAVMTRSQYAQVSTCKTVSQAT